MITVEMANEFNDMMVNAGSSLRILPDRSFDGTFNVRLEDDPYIDEEHRKVFPSNNFYSELEMFLRSKGIGKIHYNNTKLSFWTI